MLFFWTAESPESNGVGRAAELYTTPPARNALPRLLCVSGPLCFCAASTSHHVHVPTDGAYSRRHQARGFVIRNIIGSCGYRRANESSLMSLQCNYFHQCLIVWILFKPISLNGTMGKQPQYVCLLVPEPVTCVVPVRKQALICF